MIPGLNPRSGRTMDNQPINHPKFEAVMSREARQLRNDIIGLAISYGAAGQTTIGIAEFKQKIVEAYNPIVWERPILCAHNSEIYDSFMRITSTVYKAQENVGREAKGNKGGARRKDVDWLSVATVFPDTYWLQNVKDKRTGSVDPRSLDSILESFSIMYKLYSGWLISDFSHKVLFGILDVSRKYSPDLVQECMDMVTEIRQRSFDYLMAIIDKEMAARQIEMTQNKELLDRSKQILNTFVELVKGKDPIDFDSLEKDAKVDRDNLDEFNKVKNS